MIHHILKFSLHRQPYFKYNQLLPAAPPACMAIIAVNSSLRTFFQKQSVPMTNFIQKSMQRQSNRQIDIVSFKFILLEWIYHNSEVQISTLSESYASVQNRLAQSHRFRLHKNRCKKIILNVIFPETVAPPLIQILPSGD